MRRPAWDVVIIGAGPAGLSAALVLGRCRRRVLLCDRGTPRSWASKAMHGFITRDGIPPQEFRRLARLELKKYRTVSFSPREVTKASRTKGEFVVSLGKRIERARKLLIATGVTDQLPDIQGLIELFGISVFQCPYCDAWEVSNQPLAAYGRGQRGFDMARALTAWTNDIVLCTDGRSGLTTAQRSQLEHNGIRVVTRRVKRLESAGGKLSKVVFRGGLSILRGALFFDTPSWPQSPLAEQLGCQFSRHGGVLCGKYEATSVPGVYVAGNIIRDVQLSIVAAAEGTRAAFGINRALTREDFDSDVGGPMP